MANISNVSFRIDSDLKAQADTLDIIPIIRYCRED